MTEVILGLVAGLALFLYGVSRLATGMRAVAGDRMRQLIARATTNRFAGVATGTVATAALDSSSLTIIMVIALVDAGLLPFVQSLGVILGANIGTTISSQLIALDVQRYSPVVLAAGLLLHFAGRNESWRHAGIALFGMGLVFFGLGQMGAAVEPFKDSARFTDWMTSLESPLVGVAAGPGSERAYRLQCAWRNPHGPAARTDCACTSTADSRNEHVGLCPESRRSDRDLSDVRQRLARLAEAP